MTRGPKGEKRPADTAQRAHKVFHIAVGDVEDDLPSARRIGGKAGASARAEVLSAEDRKAIAKNAADIRWGKKVRRSSNNNE